MSIVGNPLIFSKSDGVKVKPLHEDLSGGYITYGNWGINTAEDLCNDVYEVVAGRTYIVGCASKIGTRLRISLLESDPALATSSINGTSVLNENDPVAFETTTYTPEANGFLTIYKGNPVTPPATSICLDITDL